MRKAIEEQTECPSKVGNVVLHDSRQHIEGDLIGT